MDEGVPVGWCVNGMDPRPGDVELNGVAIVIMLWAPKGLWGLIAELFGWQVLPLQRHLVIAAEKTENKS